MAEVKMTEAEAKAACETTKKAHEIAITKVRTDQLEYNLASEDLERARDRYRRAESAKQQSENGCYYTDQCARDAFVRLGRLQVEAKGRVG